MMSQLSEQDGLGPLECAEYQSRTAQLRTFSSICNGLQFSSLVGVFGVIASSLIGGSTLTIFWPAAIGMVVFGLGCAYLSNRFSAQANMLDADFNAKKIAAATGKSKDAPETQVAVAIEKEPERNLPGPTGAYIRNMDGEAASEEPGRRIRETVALDRVVPPAQDRAISQ
jgi:hypothetical protein